MLRITSRSAKDILVISNSVHQKQVVFWRLD